MRSVLLGADQPTGGWSPRFNVKKTRTRRDVEADRKGSAIMSYHPAMKGERRMEKLRHYHLKDMAFILDARPSVVAWTAETKPFIYEWDGDRRRLVPDFEVVEADRRYVIRYLKPGIAMTNGMKARYAALDAVFQENRSGLQVLRADEICATAEFRAARELFWHRLRDWPDELPIRVAGKWTDRLPTTLGAVHASFGGGQDMWVQLLALAAHGFIHLDIGKGIDGATPVIGCGLEGYRVG